MFWCVNVDTIYGYYKSRFGSLGPSYKGEIFHFRPNFDSINDQFEARDLMVWSEATLPKKSILSHEKILAWPEKNPRKKCFTLSPVRKTVLTSLRSV